MVVNCEQVWREISNYLEDDVDPALRAAMEEHLRQCKKCMSVLEGTRNVIHLFGDERLSRVPFGFSWRLHGKLAQNLPGRRGTAYGWIVALASVGVIAGSLTVAHSKILTPPLRSEKAHPGQAIPPELSVLVAENTKVFHVAGCTFIHDKGAKLRSMKASEAVEEGYVPCVRCLGKYLSDVAAEFIRKHVWAMAMLG